MTIRFALAATAGLAVALAASAPARADVIDGDWCSLDGGRMMSIHGPTIVTPGGTRTQGDYRRHAFSYQVPAGEAKAGSTVSLVLLNEDAVRIDDGTAQASPSAQGEIWHRCRLPTS